MTRISKPAFYVGSGTCKQRDTRFGANSATTRHSLLNHLIIEHLVVTTSVLPPPSDLQFAAARAMSRAAIDAAASGWKMSIVSRAETLGSTAQKMNVMDDARNEDH